MKVEPVAIIESAKAVLLGLFPVLTVFDVISWEETKLAVVETFVILLVTTFGGWFTRSRVTPV